jgi:HSP20 family protein
MADQTTMTKESVNETNGVEQIRAGHYYRPNVDILEREEELLLRADVPGAQSDAIDVRFEEGMLTIHAKLQPRQSPETEYLLREYGVGDYYRTFRISEAIDASKISADFTEGVLTLHLPKSEAVRPRKIKVGAQT